MCKGCMTSMRLLDLHIPNARMTPSVYITCRNDCEGTLIEELHTSGESTLIKEPRIYGEGTLIKELRTYCKGILINKPRTILIRTSQKASHNSWRSPDQETSNSSYRYLLSLDE
ncbi:hypothetical protein Fot_05272 [Forsythia ovata]|uniref:Uncharacterized protein n=1 Tax=Forsythia ovata TaxID=205694 RepID=A0ABD1WPQ2_9LAMI